MLVLWVIWFDVIEEHSYRASAVFIYNPPSIAVEFYFWLPPSSKGRFVVFTHLIGAYSAPVQFRTINYILVRYHPSIVSRFWQRRKRWSVHYIVFTSSQRDNIFVVCFEPSLVFVETNKVLSPIFSTKDVTSKMIIRFSFISDITHLIEVILLRNRIY